MDNGNLLHTHSWSERKPHQFKQEGKTILLLQCSDCRRDFALGLDGSGWRAVYIGIFKAELLAQAHSKRWLNEKCPGRQLPDDDAVRGLARAEQKAISVDSALSHVVPQRKP